jgi:hypothetical protein
LGRGNKRKEGRGIRKLHGLRGQSIHKHH